MMPLCWAVLLICSFSTSGATIIFREPGESIILKCSSDKCTKSSEGHSGMYLYHEFTEKKEVYFFSNYSGSKFLERPGYTGKFLITGNWMSHNITITNLTVGDSGIYTCIYKELADESDECSLYTVFVRGLAPCPIQEPNTTAEKRFLIMLLWVIGVIGVCVISMLLIMIFILVIMQMVKQRSIDRRAAQRSQQESNDFVYEVMTKSNHYHVALPE